MSGAEREQADGLEHAAGEPHIHDYEGHVRAVEADLEYYRVKRFEPRVFSMVRRGIVTLYDLITAGSRLESSAEPAPLPAGPSRDLASRIRALEDGLDDYVRGIALLQSTWYRASISSSRTPARSGATTTSSSGSRSGIMRGRLISAWRS